ncbi:MAG TPA: nicotinamide riboside transporter PnuC [Gemmatimonadaceae bacterium]|nr:nicotinamide riboside transporter PnuC [Gemmatimonadaceae bacterium]
MTTIEAFAALFGIISVYLGTRQNVWIWPTGIVNVGLYIIVFYQARLYADMGLQVVYLVLSAYGWYAWLYGGAQHSALRVTRTTPRVLLALLVVNLAVWLALATILDRHTDAVLPWLDSLLATTSLVAQWMMTRKLLESWLVWIAVDIVYVPMYVSRGLDVTAVLYAVFLILAFVGYRDWRTSWRAHAELEPA